MCICLRVRAREGTSSFIFFSCDFRLEFVRSIQCTLYPSCADTVSSSQTLIESKNLVDQLHCLQFCVFFNRTSFYPSPFFCVFIHFKRRYPLSWCLFVFVCVFLLFGVSIVSVYWDWYHTFTHAHFETGFFQLLIVSDTSHNRYNWSTVKQYGYA